MIVLGITEMSVAAGVVHRDRRSCHILSSLHHRTIRWVSCHGVVVGRLFSVARHIGANDDPCASGYTSARLDSLTAL